MPFLMISVLRTACSSVRYGTQKKKMQHIGSLKVERPLTIPTFYFFIIRGVDTFVKKALTN